MVGLISLDPKFFMFGDAWKKIRWFSYISKIPQNTFNYIVIFSDTKFICQEALYEMMDVKVDTGSNVTILSELLSNEIRQASTTEDRIIDILKLRLSD